MQKYLVWKKNPGWSEPLKDSVNEWSVIKIIICYNLLVKLFNFLYTQASEHNGF